jgi:hypothetical protein
MITLPTDRSNSLVVLAARIRAAHEATSTALKSSVEHSIAAGELLIEAKEQVPHGQWLPWLRDRCAISERTAQLYMRLAKNRKEIEANTQCVADLTLNEAAALLALSSNLRELLDFARRLQETTTNEEFVNLCISEGVGLYSYDPYDGQSEDDFKIWQTFRLFLAERVGFDASDAEQHIHWILRHDFKTPCEYMGEEGDKYRASIRMKPMPARTVQAWQEFKAANEGADIASIVARVNEAIERQQGRRTIPRRRRRRSRGRP